MHYFFIRYLYFRITHIKSRLRLDLLDDDINEAEFRFNSSTSTIMEIVEKLAVIKADAPKELTKDIRKEYKKGI